MIFKKIQRLKRKICGCLKIVPKCDLYYIKRKKQGKAGGFPCVW